MIMHEIKNPNFDYNEIKVQRADELAKTYWLLAYYYSDFLPMIIDLRVHLRSFIRKQFRTFLHSAYSHYVTRNRLDMFMRHHLNASSCESIHNSHSYVMSFNVFIECRSFIHNYAIETMKDPIAFIKHCKRLWNVDWPGSNISSANFHQMTDNIQQQIHFFNYETTDHLQQINLLLSMSQQDLKNLFVDLRKLSDTLQNPIFNKVARHVQEMLQFFDYEISNLQFSV